MVRKASYPRRKRRPVVQLRARDIFSHVAVVVRKHWLGLLLVSLPFALAAGGLEQSLLNAYPRHIHDIRAASILAFYGTTAIAYLAMAAISIFVWPRIHDNATLFTEPLTARRGLAVLGLALVAPLGVLAGLAVAIIPGIIISLSWCLAPAASTLRGESVSGGLSHSARLTWGSRWSLFFVFASGYVAMVALSCVSAVLMGRSVGQALSDITPPSAPQAIVDGLLQVLQIAFNGTVATTFFAAALKGERLSSRN
jgi:hypothetical protein